MSEEVSLSTDKKCLSSHDDRFQGRQVSAKVTNGVELIQHKRGEIKNEYMRQMSLHFFDESNRLQRSALRLPKDYGNKMNSLYKGRIQYFFAPSRIAYFYFRFEVK